MSQPPPKPSAREQRVTKIVQAPSVNEAVRGAYREANHGNSTKGKPGKAKK